MKKNCLQCNKIIEKSKTRSVKDFEFRTKFCSRICRSNSMIGKKPWNKDIHTGIKPWLGKHQSEEHHRKNSLSHLGKPPWNKNRSGLQMAWNKGLKTSLIPSSAFKKGHESRFRGKSRPEMAGKNHWNYQGGLTNLNSQIRNSYVYKDCIKRAMRRDDYVCRICDEMGGILNVNHRKPFALIIRENNIQTLEQAINCKGLWDLDNLETLCESCHKKTDTYLSGTSRLLRELNYHN